MKVAFFLIAALACIVVIKAYPRDDQEETNAVYETLASEDSGSLTHQTAYAEDGSSEDGDHGDKGDKGKGGKGKGGKKDGKGGKKDGKGKGKGKGKKGGDETAETAPADA